MKKQIVMPIVFGVVINLLFLLTEIIFQFLGVFDEKVRLYVVDGILRFVFGAAALYFIYYCYKREMCAFSLKEHFTNKIPKETWLYVMPFAYFLLLEIVKLFFANAYTFRLLWLWPLNIMQQILTGWFEESVRVLCLAGMVRYMCNTGKGRVKTVLISGAIFGLSHGLNFFFGQGIADTLVQVLSCAIWGFLMAAVFLLSKNLPLLMAIHAVWDTVIRIDNFFFGFPEDSLALTIIDILGYLYYPLMIFAAFYVAVKYEKITGNASVSN